MELVRCEREADEGGGVVDLMDSPSQASQLRLSYVQDDFEEDFVWQAR